MRVFRVFTVGEVREALGNVHSTVHLHLAEKDGEDIGMSYQDPLHPSVSRLLDVLPYEEPVAPCWLKGKGGLEPVVAILLESDGVHLVLDHARAKPVG